MSKEFKGPDWKPVKRRRDKTLGRQLHSRGVICVLCGKPGSLHHLYPRGQGGDDVHENLVGLCGDGTRGDHGLIEAGDEATRRSLGAYIEAQRPDLVFYLQEKLGYEEGREWLRQRFFMDL